MPRTGPVASIGLSPIAQGGYDDKHYADNKCKETDGAERDDDPLFLLLWLSFFVVF